MGPIKITPNMRAHLLALIVQGVIFDETLEDVQISQMVQDAVNEASALVDGLLGDSCVDEHVKYHQLVDKLESLIVFKNH
jgi:hypothetical protein